jgi:hypothetical protein
MADGFLFKAIAPWASMPGGSGGCFTSAAVFAVFGGLRFGRFPEGVEFTQVFTPSRSELPSLEHDDALGLHRKNQQDVASQVPVSEIPANKILNDTDYHL